jgi:hypothetical protein
MKDMSVEELLHIMSQSLFDADLINAEAELLRRFEVLEKEVEKHKRTAICMYCGTVQQTKDGQEKLAMIIEHMAVCKKHPVPKLLGDIENMKNCGNCHNFYRADMAELCRKTFPFNVCKNWQSDWLTRAERERE